MSLMQPIRVVALVLLIPCTLSCASFRRPVQSAPPTAGDPRNAPTYGYHPIDPLPVLVLTGSPTGPPATSAEILGILPDETMRIAIGEVESTGNVTFGPAKTGVAGKSYVVILDYIKFQTQPFAVEKTEAGIRRVEKFTGASAKTANVVPVYVGVGLRLTANITVTQGSVDLGNLFALGVAAQARQVTGTMVVQTLGVSGQNISTLIPMPGEINPTTLQNAILALGAIKAKLYDQGTSVNPRVVGVYNTLGGGQETINAFISALLDAPQDVQIPPRPTP